MSRGAVHFTAGKNLVGEPRDHLEAVYPGGRAAPLPAAVDLGLVQRFGALFRVAQMAGAMEAALDLSTRYANDRVQFGRPIAKLQAIQQQLALLAEHSAAASVVGRVRRHSRRGGASHGSAGDCFGENLCRRSRGEGGRDRSPDAWRDRFHLRAPTSVPDPPPVVMARRVR